MNNLLWSDIQAQAENLRHVVAHLYGPERKQLVKAASFLDNDRPVILIGVASAEYLCMPSEYYFTQHGRIARSMCASDALYSHLSALHNANIIINTRSGETIEVVRLGRALVEAGIPFLALTNEPESSLAQMATHIIWASTHKDDLVSINVVTGMMTATLALAAAANGELDILRPDFERLPDQIGAVVSLASTKAAEFQSFFNEIRPIYQLYRGASKGSASCARLALEEIARTPGIAMEAAEFRQGPNEVIDERFGAMVYIPAGKQGELNRSLVGDILNCGGKVLSIGNPTEIADNPNHQTFALPETAEFLRPVLEVVPAQLLAYHLAKAQGYNPGTTRYITKVILSEEGIPNRV
jgi:glucosamine--fructose-6-phosphate aminotransferase (isomerizing)